MSTRAVYTFIDEWDTHHVYKHHDGYPEGAVKWIRAALDKAWGLPRFEADEFAASFIAANKDGPGDMRLTEGPQRHGDLDYRYEVTVLSESGDDLWVREYRVAGSDETLIFAGSLTEAMRLASFAE